MGIQDSNIKEIETEQKKCTFNGYLLGVLFRAALVRLCENVLGYLNPHAVASERKRPFAATKKKRFNFNNFTQILIALYIFFNCKKE